MPVKPTGCVYFLRAENGLIKIGYTDGDPDSRLARLQATCPVPLAPLGLMDGGRAVEQKLHLRFDSLWTHGEWFRPGPELLSLIEVEARPWDPRPVAYRRPPRVRAKGRTMQQWAEETEVECWGEKVTIAHGLKTRWLGDHLRVQQVSLTEARMRYLRGHSIDYVLGFSSSSSTRVPPRRDPLAFDAEALAG